MALWMIAIRASLNAMIPWHEPALPARHHAISILMHGRNSHLERRLVGGDQSLLSVSVVTFGEIRFGLAMRPGASRLAAAAEAAMRRQGKTLDTLDMLIAAHAVSVRAILVTADRAFRHVPRLETEDWTA